MPKTKHHKKKYPNSEWVRRRNIRKMMAKQASKQDSSGKQVAMVDLLENIKKTHSPSQEKKPKGLLEGMKSVFAGLKKSTKNAV
jgi:hypothetical protein